MRSIVPWHVATDTRPLSGQEMSQQHVMPPLGGFSETCDTQTVGFNQLWLPKKVCCKQPRWSGSQGPICRKGHRQFEAFERPTACGIAQYLARGRPSLSWFVAPGKRPCSRSALRKCFTWHGLDWSGGPFGFFLGHHAVVVDVELLASTSYMASNALKPETGDAKLAWHRPDRVSLQWPCSRRCGRDTACRLS